MKKIYNAKSDLSPKTSKTDSVRERLHMALEASHSGVWEIDISTNMISFDDRIKEILDYNTKENTVSISEWNEFLKTRFTDEAYEQAIPLRDLESSINNILYVSATKKYIQFFSKPVFDENGTVIKRIGLTMDVTEREELLNTLQNTKETFHVALQSSNAGYWEIPLTNDGKYIMHYEENFAKLFKIEHYRPFTTVEWSDYLMPILDPVEYKDFHNFLRNFDASVEKVVTDAHLKFPDGTETYIKNSAQLSYDRTGKPDKMIGLCVDFTERIKSLELANKMSETLLNSMNQMIYVADIDTDEVIFVNDVMLEAFNVKGDYSGKKYWEIFSGCNIESVEKAKEKLNKNPNEPATWELYQSYLKKELSCVARYISWIDGRTVCFRTYFDISSLKQAERSIQEQLKHQKLMADISKAFIQVDDVDTTINYSLRSIGENLDCYRTVLSLYDKENDTMGNDYEWFNPNITNCARGKVAIKFSSTKTAFKKIMIDKVPYAIVNDYQHFSYLKDDKNLKSLLFVPFYIDGEFIGLLEVMKSHSNSDWTESEIQLAMMVGSTYSMFFSRHRISENLVQAMISAENANNAKSSFLSNMSHEIRTPLNAIIGMTSIAMKDNISDTTRKYLENIKNASDVLLDIINNVLDMSKIEAAKLELTDDYFKLSDLLDNIHNIVSVRANEKFQTIEFNVNDDVPNSYIGDYLRLTQVITNIIYNAIKFSDDNTKIKLDINLDSLDNDVACLKIDIADQGVGMTPEQIERLFKPFEQGDNRTVRKYGGTGLGLTISKQIAELMNGNITAESTPGKGSVFTITVKLTIADSQLVATTISDDILPEHLDLSSKTILLVEDIEINRDIVKFLLEETHINIEEAENGQVCVELFKNNPGRYDLILMDIQMPELDGYSATKIIREIDKQIPVIAMTAHAFKEDEHKSIASGMNAHLNKPIDGNNLIKVIKHYLF